MVSLDDVTKAVAGIPTVVVRWIIFPSLTVIGIWVWLLTGRVTALEQERAVTEAQRAAEIRSIDTLTTQVEGMRKDQQETARKQEGWMMQILQTRR